jgi:hypothetical protein
LLLMLVAPFSEWADDLMFVAVLFSGLRALACGAAAWPQRLSWRS